MNNKAMNELLNEFRKSRIEEEKQAKLNKTIYLAGKITGNNWRDEIITDWSAENHGADCYVRGNLEEWAIKNNSIKCGKHTFNYSGPYWVTDGCHDYANDDTKDVYKHLFLDKRRHIFASTDELHELIFNKVVKAIKKTDIVFTWIDSHECHGTVVEAFLAKALKKNVYVYYKNDILSDEHFMLNQLVGKNAGHVENTALKAFQHFCKTLES